MKIRKSSYWLETNNEFVNEFYMELLDMLGFKQHIVLLIYRALPNCVGLIKSCFADNEYKVVADSTRNDCYAVYFESLKTNKQIYNLMVKMDEQTEFIYLPNCKSFETVLFNRRSIEKQNAVKYGICPYQVVFDQDYGMHLIFEEKEENLNYAIPVLQEWENKARQIYKITKKLTSIKRI